MALFRFRAIFIKILSIFIFYFIELLSITNNSSVIYNIHIFNLSTSLYFHDGTRFHLINGQLISDNKDVLSVMSQFIGVIRYSTL